MIMQLDKVHNDVTLDSTEITAIVVMCQLIDDLKLTTKVESISNTKLASLESKMAEIIHSNCKFYETTIEDAKENNRVS